MAYISFQPSDFFNNVIWSGDNTSPINITGLGFQPDFVWGKLRNTGYSNQLYDSVRGFGNDKEIQSDTTTVQGGGTADQYGYLSGVVADGFTATAGSDGGADKYGYWNESGKTYVAWNWKAGTTTGLTGGTLTPSAYSFNTTSGFGIYAYTGTGANATIPHGLGVAPHLVIVKHLSGASDWEVGNSSFTSWAYHLGLNLTTAESSSATCWNSTAPTSTVFSVGTNGAINGSGQTFVAYCFASIKGYSKFGSYTGNANADGPFIYTGFRPAYFLLRRIDVGNDWVVMDNKINPFNLADTRLRPNNSGAEATSAIKSLDILSNGVKIRTSDAEFNAVGTYIYAAFAEFPFVSSNSIPTVAR